MAQFFDDQQEAWWAGGREWYNKQQKVPVSMYEIPADFDPYLYWAETHDDQDDWSLHREERKKKKLSNREWSINFLKDNGIEMTLLNDTSGHFRYGEYDFWPSTGKFINIKTKKSGRGVKNLFNILKNLPGHQPISSQQ